MICLKSIAIIITLTIVLITSSAIASPYANSRAVVVSGGENHTLVLTADANLWACGDNYWYQLGVGDDKTDRALLVRVHDGNMATDSNYLESIIAADAGWQHSLALDVNNNTWAWGNNQYGELGNGKSGALSYESTPVQVHKGEMWSASGFLENIVAVSAGRSGEFSLALDDANHCWSFGKNNKGQLGNGQSGSSEKEDTPVAVHAGEQNPGNPGGPLSNIVCISAGEEHSAAVDLDGSVFCWGDNLFYRKPYDPGKLGTGTTADHNNTPVQVLKGEQPGEGTYLENIVEVSVGWDHTLALEDYVPFDPNRQGKMFSWGCNKKVHAGDCDGGQLGDGSDANSSTPVIVHAGQQNPTSPNSALKAIIAVSAGENHSIALDVNGFVYAFGCNFYGQLGNGTTTNSTKPVQVLRGDNDEPLSDIVAISAGYWHSLAIDADGTIWTWGKCNSGSLGVGATITDELSTAARPINLVYNLTKQNYQFGIQTAINDANNGNIIEVPPGTYFEDIDLGNKTLTLRSTNPSDWDVVEKTTIYGPGSGDSYVVKLGQSQSSHISGFKITNADTAIECCDSATPLITNCLLAGNEYNGLYLYNDADVDVYNTKIISNAGAGVYCDGYPSHPAVTLTDCIVSDNGTAGIYSIVGDVNVMNCLINHNAEPGIYCEKGNVNVAWSVITDNIQDGIHTQSLPNINITHSIIADNGNNGVFLEDCVFFFTAEVVNNWIYNNGTSSGGAGLDVNFSNVEVYDQAIVRNNTIVNNATYGINLLYAQDAVIDNCIVYNNGDSASDNIHKDGGAPFYVSFSCVEGSFTGTGNIDDDPCFADPNWATDPDANNFHIGPNSLCIDKGKLNSTGANETDIDGEDRVIFGRTVLRVDIGADEYYWPKADYDKSEIVNFIDFAYFANAWHETNTTINLDGDNFVDINDLILFCGDWLWVAPWSARYEQMMTAGSRTMDTQTAIAATTQAPGFMPGVHPTAPAQAEPLSAERIEELINWTEQLFETNPELKETVTQDQIDRIIDSLKAELE